MEERIVVAADTIASTLQLGPKLLMRIGYLPELALEATVVLPFSAK